MAANEEMYQSQEHLQQLVTQLEESERRARKIVAAAPFPIGVNTGRDMRITMANQTIMDVWGKGSEVIGKIRNEILPELAGQEIYQQLDQIFLTGIPLHARNQRVDIEVDGKMQPRSRI